jgi:ATP-binding cassette subfamily B protein
MNYTLSDENTSKKVSFLTVIRETNRFIGGFSRKVIWMGIGALLMVLIGSVINVITPEMIGDASQAALMNRDKDALLQAVIGLLILFIGTSIAGYFQILLMGWIGQEILAKLRAKIFEKIQELPLAFFNQNKSGDLISRINNDTDKLNQALSETLLRFVGSIFVMIGIAGAMLVLNPLLGVFSLSISVVLFVITNLISNFLKRINRRSLNATGNLSAEIQESLTNYKVVVAFNRKDYFRNSFQEVNENSKQANIVAGIGNNILTPIYEFAGNFALFTVYFVGISLIINQTFTLFGITFTGAIEFGTLVSYTLYVDRFYSPLRIMAQLFSSIQMSLAAWARISELLSLETNLEVIDDERIEDANGSLIEFKDVSFGYNPEALVLKKENLKLVHGKTYALVGPTGGGKSTTAGLLARLFDPVEGEVTFNGKNIKSYPKDELAKRIGFILQDPFLFSGTIRENIVYANPKYKDLNEEELKSLLEQKGLSKLLERFPKGLETEVSNSADTVSLGQKQLIAFLRVILREPELLILDEATANIDTVTENLLQEILDKLTGNITKIIIAHRLNTISKADEIFFIANGAISEPVNYTKALELINDTKKNS